MSTASLLVYLGKPIDHWLGQLSDPDPLVRRLATHALSMIGPEGCKASVPALTAVLDDPESFVRVWAAAALARVDPANRRALEALIAALHDEQSFVRSLGAWHLGRQGPDMPDTAAALTALHDLLDDPDPSVRAEAELALKELLPGSVRVRG